MNISEAKAMLNHMTPRKGMNMKLSLDEDKEYVAELYLSNEKGGTIIEIQCFTWKNAIEFFKWVHYHHPKIYFI